MQYGLDKNAVLEYFLELEKFPVDENEPRKQDAVLGLVDISVEKLVRVDDKIVNAVGEVYAILRNKGSYKDYNIKVSIPILYDTEDRYGVKKEMDADDFENQLKPFNEDSDYVGQSLRIVTGDEAEKLWEDFKRVEKYAKEFASVEPAVRFMNTNVEVILRLAQKNTKFKDSYTKRQQRFGVLAQSLVEKHAGKLKLSECNGVLVLNTSKKAPQGVGTIYMTPLNAYLLGVGRDPIKIYDLREKTIEDSVMNLAKLNPEFVSNPEVLMDLANLVGYLNLRRKMPNIKKINV